MSVTRETRSQITRAPGSGRRRAFTLVELLAVVGIIAVLMSLLMPALSKARRQANRVVCLSNLRQVGVALVAYSNQWRGVMYPPRLGANRPREQRWPVHVFDPPAWNPPVMLCPEDVDPVEEHSYILNDHLYEQGVKYSTTAVGAARLTPDRVVLMGEKVTASEHYYMNPAGTWGGPAGDYDQIVEFFRHGSRLGSNYLYLDLHADTSLEGEARIGIDSWAVTPDPVEPDPANPPAGP